MNGCPSRSTPPKATWRRSSTLTARRAPDVTAAPTLRAQLPYLYLRKMPDRTIVWTSPTGRVYRTRPDGYDLFPQLRPACRAPTARRRSHSHDKRIAHAAAGFAINARSTPKPGVSTAHAHKKSPTATGATTCAKCSSCSKAPNRAPALVHLGQRPTRTRTTPTRLETTTPTTTPTRRRATLLRRTMKILVATALTQGTSPDDYHYGTEGRAGVAAGTV